ncbi:hypothetical protein FKP32DRAFT_1673460 [Trametes sanguinea]|nr:hypothetical protein FKP32DRAFT_1673460 [Trametes sanguinea]
MPFPSAMPLPICGQERASVDKTENDRDLPHASAPMNPSASSSCLLLSAPLTAQEQHKRAARRSACSVVRIETRGAPRTPKYLAACRHPALAAARVVARNPTTSAMPAARRATAAMRARRTRSERRGENVRKIVPIDSPQFGRVTCVCIGAMMVGSIHMTVEEGQQGKRGQEFGCFAFGGSTIVVLFEKGAVQRDEDLLINSRACLETLVRVGMGIGHGKRKPNTDGGGAQ